MLSVSMVVERRLKIFFSNGTKVRQLSSGGYSRGGLGVTVLRIKSSGGTRGETKVGKVPKGTESPITGFRKCTKRFGSETPDRVCRG